jgi:sugar phosphate isomerase/epimerase
MPAIPLTRRQFHHRAGAALAAAALGPAARSADPPPSPFRLRYIVASCMYGNAPLAEIVPEVRKCGAEHIEIWAAPHGNQRAQLDAMGADAFRALLKQHDAQLGSFTCFGPGILSMQGEMKLIKDLGGDLAIANSRGPKDLAGEALHAAVAEFATQLRPHVEFAEELGVTIGLENHSGGLISSPESQLRLLDLIPSQRFGIALAPAHLPQNAEVIARLIEQLGERLVHFQAWEFGQGFIGAALPPEEQLLQLPHRGPLDWRPIVAALRKINYAGRTEVFMHPTPRGIPIRETTAEVTAEINASREYLEGCLKTGKA